jgi:hypothetical protein
MINPLLNTADTVAAIKARGGVPVCAISAGTWERWAPDAGAAAAEDKGAALGWAGERWLNIRSEAVRAGARARLQACKEQGYAGAALDRLDGYANDNGLGLTASDQLAYNRWLAAAGHELGLGVGLKNDVAQVADLAGDFDFFVNE